LPAIVDEHAVAYVVAIVSRVDLSRPASPVAWQVVADHAVQHGGLGWRRA
jgi:hypothetical protein